LVVEVDPLEMVALRMGLRLVVLVVELLEAV
jgi:hypothetical protein